MNVFGHIRQTYNGALTPNANFDGFFNSVNVLFSCATGENFNLLMYSSTIQAPYCTPDEHAAPGMTGNCGVSLATAAIYWVCFYTITASLLLSLLVAVVLETFVEDGNDDNADGLYLLNPEARDRYETLWARYDPQHRMVLPVAKVALIVAQLPGPLGVAPAHWVRDAALTKQGPGDDGAGIPVAQLSAAEKLVHSLPLVPDDDDCLHFTATLQALTDRASDVGLLGERVSAVVMIGAVRSSMHRLPLHELAAIRRVQAAYRLHLKARLRHAAARAPDRNVAVATGAQE